MLIKILSPNNILRTEQYWKLADISVHLDISEKNRRLSKSINQ